MTPAGARTDSVTVDGLLGRAAAEWGELTAVVDGTRRTTYRELAALCRDVAGGLAALGVAKGDRVAISMPNRLEWVTAFFGAVSAGPAAGPPNTALPPAPPPS